ncbi:hypothetical protein Pint_17894 [Pistacia integerrima]|uniref:Uncharacterized protein n=1 Tax=Pistacia integerrima TaxID=434235 RepID=A0ACC0YVI7_9ROSI|nr:hypothetical protein Pint_17894 [Pistacia integerrima]
MTQEIPFPSPLELTVASALLLLSSPDQQPPPSHSSPQFDTDGELLLKSKSYSDEESVSMNESLASTSSGSKRSASWLTSEASSDEIRAHQLRIIAVVARCHEMKLKVYSSLWFSLSVLRKSRSKISRKITVAKPPPPTVKSVSSESLSTEVGSSLSSSASAVTSVRSPCVSERRQMMVAREKPKRKTGGSTHIQRRADAILKLLSSGGCSSETRIRRFLGDSPDTSKALRMLLKLDEVKRSGTGGRQDPYIYTIA